MLEKSFDEIMQDYEEQKEEWETLLSMNNGSIERFMLVPGGKTYFCVKSDKSISELKIDEEAINDLSRESVSKQMLHYKIKNSVTISNIFYGEVLKETRQERDIPLSEYLGIKKIVLYKNVIVGAIITDAFGKDVVLSVNETVLTYYASDNERVGSNEREESVTLLTRQINSLTNNLNCDIIRV